jgi:hypothetical protein
MANSFSANLFFLLSTFPVAADDSVSSIRLPVLRDASFSQAGREADTSVGGAPRLHLKSNRVMVLLDVDPSPLRGRVVRRATVHLRLADKEPLRRITVGSVGAEWFEESSTFKHRRPPDAPWSFPGSNLSSVILSAGGTVWRMSDATPPDAEGWQHIPVDPVVVAARVAGVSYGFVVFDDTGTEWKREGENFTEFLFPNRFVHSREAGAVNAPYLTVLLGAEDKDPPDAVGGLQSEIGDLPAGEAWVSWVTPQDHGTAGTIGFLVGADGKEVPRHLIPAAGSPGERVRMHLRDLGLPAGATVKLDVRAVDGAGNVGPVAAAALRVSAHQARPLPGVAPRPLEGIASLPQLGGAEVAILDELDKLHPVTGEIIPAQAEAYLSANHLWSAKDGQIRLYAGRNEFIAFQVLLRGKVTGVQPTLSFAGDAAAQPQVAFGGYGHVTSKRGPLPDPIAPLRQAVSVPDAEEKIPGQKSASLHCEVYVPHQARAGLHEGKLVLRAGGEALTFPVSLHVWDFTLPDYLSFLPDMNCYGLPQNERAYYRLAHRHRTVLNRVPYSQSGNISRGCAPIWDGHQLDWTAWDERFGPYLDGSAFADLPRRGVPLESFYLPLHENWPSPMNGNYNGDYWADRAFPASYRRTLVEVARQFSEHCNVKGWNDTLFQGFCNNKYYYKRNGWSRGSSPWLLDEPSNFQDYWALRYFGSAFHEGFSKAPGKAKMVFRCDISRPQWQRNTFDGLLDYNVVASATRPYYRLVIDRKAATGELVIEYGSANEIEKNNMQPVGWSLDAWSLGTDGVLPWQVIGRPRSWEQADTLSLFYPAQGQDAEPVPSVRLKAFRRGQQDVEYLTLWSQLQKEPRWAVGKSVQRALRLAAERRDTGGEEDVGVLDYNRLRPQDVWALRMRIGQALSEAKPEPKRKLVELRTPPRDPTRLVPALESTQP